jgi:hypothetical protein
MPGAVTPHLIPCVNFVTLDSPVELIRIVVSENENWIGSLLELLNELGLFWSVGEVAHGPQKFVAGVSPVEDTREFVIEFPYDIDIAWFLLWILGIGSLDVLTRKVHELHAAVKAVDDLSGGHSVTSVDELAPRDKVDVVHALVTRLDGCAVSDLEKPLTDFATRKVAVDIGADVQQRVLEADALELLSETSRLDVGNVGITEKFLDNF